MKKPCYKDKVIFYIDNGNIKKPFYGEEFYCLYFLGITKKYSFNDIIEIHKERTGFDIRNIDCIVEIFCSGAGFSCELEYEIEGDNYYYSTLQAS